MQWKTQKTAAATAWARSSITKKIIYDTEIHAWIDLQNADLFRLHASADVDDLPRTASLCFRRVCDFWWFMATSTVSQMIVEKKVWQGRWRQTLHSTIQFHARRSFWLEKNHWNWAKVSDDDNLIRDLSGARSPIQNPNDFLGHIKILLEIKFRPRTTENSSKVNLGGSYRGEVDCGLRNSHQTDSSVIHEPNWPSHIQL